MVSGFIEYLRMRETRYLLLFLGAIFQTQAAIVFTVDNPIQFSKAACYPGTYNPGGLHEFGDCYVAQGPSVSFSGTLENTGTEDFTVDTINAAFSMWGNTLSYTFTGSGPTVGGSMAWVGYTATIGGLGLHVPAGGSVGFIPFNVQFDPGTSYDRTGVETLTLTFAQSSPL